MIVNDDFFGQVFNGTKKADDFEIIGGSSNKIYAAAGNDTIVINTRSKANFAENGNDIVNNADVEGNYISAGAGNDVINVENGYNNTILADAGNDTINVYGGSQNTIYGGAGNDNFNIWWKPDMNIVLDQTGSSSKDNDKLTIYDVASTDVNISIETNNIILKANNGGQITLTNINVASFSQILFAKDNKNYLVQSAGSKAKVNGSASVEDEVYILGGSKHTVNTYGGNDNISIMDGSSHTVKAGDGEDRIILSGGSSVKAYGDGGKDHLEIVGGTSQTIYGGNDDDKLYINDGNSHKAYGDAGDDYIEVNTGNSHAVYGGNNNDTIVINSQGSSITAKGDAGNDNIYVNAGTNHSLYGGAGNDYIEINSNSNKIYGEAGDDFVAVKGNNNTVDTGKNNDTVNIVAGEYNTIKTADGNDNVNILGGNNNTIDTGKNNDTVTIRSGEYNTIKTVDGDDRVEVFGGSNNTVYTGKGKDTIRIEGGALNTINTENDNDSIYVYGGNNSINTGAGNDYINLNAGFNVVYGGAGNDSFEVYGGENYLYGEAGNDTFNIYGSAFVNGGAGSDVYNVTWNDKLDLRIVQSGNGSKDKDVLNIKNLQSSDVRFSYDDNNRIVITGKNGGQTVISDYGTTIFNYIQFADGVKFDTKQIKIEAEKVWEPEIPELQEPEVPEVKEPVIPEPQEPEIPEVNEPIIPEVKEPEIPEVNEPIIPDNQEIEAPETSDTLTAVPRLDEKLGNNRFFVPEKEEAVVKPLEFTQIINGTDNADVFNVELKADDVVKIEGGNGKDTYNLQWTTGAHVVINQKSNDVDNDLLNITGLDFNNVDFFFDDNTDSLFMSDKAGGSIEIQNWPNNMLYTTNFNGSKYQNYKLYDYMWFEYTPKATKGSINIIDKEFVNFECNINRNFTISTDDEGNGKLVIDMTKVSGLCEYEYNQSKTDFGIILTNNKGTESETTASLTLSDVSKGGFESLCIGDVKTFYFVKSGEADYTSKETTTLNELVFTGVNTKELETPVWDVTVNKGQATLNFSQLQFAADNAITVDTAGNYLLNVEKANTINAVQNNNDLQLTYSDIYKEKNRNIGTITIKDFFNAEVAAEQLVYINRTGENKAYNLLRVVEGRAVDGVVDTNAYQGDVLCLTGAGNDNIIAKAGSYVLAQDGNDTIVSTGDYVDIFGGSGNDNIKLGTENQTKVEYNTAFGGEGNDTISVFGNTNGVNAGLGNDIIVIEKGNNNIAYAGDGKDQIVVNGENNYLYGENGNDTILIKSGENNQVYGGNDDDIITVEAANGSRIYGGYGCDTIVIDGGNNNQVNGGEDNDILTINGGTSNKINGGTGDDELYITGGTKNYAYGDAGKDYICITGGETNYAYGRDGDDLIFIEGGNKISVNGDAGNDEIVVFAGTGHTVHGGAGDDIIYIDGGSKNEVGTVTAYGDAGNDTFVIESTAQGLTLSGGLGSDLYDVDWTLGHKMVIKNGDYAAGDVDTLNLHNVDTSDFTVTYNESTGILLMTDSANGTIKIEGYSKNPLAINCHVDALAVPAMSKMMSDINNASYSFVAAGYDNNTMTAMDTVNLVSQNNMVYGNC